MGGRRLLILLVLSAAIGIPAGVHSVTCANGSCGDRTERASLVPFCPLPIELRERLVNGYREERSPDVLGVATEMPIVTSDDGGPTAWPGVGKSSDDRVPMVFWGAGVARTDLPDGVGLDSIAPTVSEALGFERPFPEVRSGLATPGVASGERPSLVLLVAWKGVGSSDLASAAGRDWAYLRSLLQEGAGTLDATTGSLPVDPVATLTTIGTGGLPSQHGITGSVIRNDEGRVVRAYGPDAPVTVIATLADDLDHAAPSSLVGAVLTADLDRGIVGDGWYRHGDPVDAVIGESGRAPSAVRARLATGYGADEVADVLAVVLDGDVRSLDRWTRRIVADAELATDGSALVVVAGTGSREYDRTAVPDSGLRSAVEAAVPGDAQSVERVVPGGFFLDQNVLRHERVTGLVAVEAMRSATAAGGRAMLTDAFQGFAVSFARYC
ncbi:MAG TPA: hypothetical protein VJ913_05860 [Actinomycetota bacterium]|nr:hypothetical protein [Actinomycetota bacterium]